MHVISRKKIREFLETHPDRKDSEAPLDRWYRIARKSTWANFAEVKAAFNAVDAVGRFLVFDIKGNDFRLVAELFYRDQVLLIRHVLTHSEYDAGTWKSGTESRGGRSSSGKPLRKKRRR